MGRKNRIAGIESSARVERIALTEVTTSLRLAIGRTILASLLASGAASTAASTLEATGADIPQASIGSVSYPYKDTLTLQTTQTTGTNPEQLKTDTMNGVSAEMSPDQATRIVTAFTGQTSDDLSSSQIIELRDISSLVAEKFPTETSFAPSEIDSITNEINAILASYEPTDDISIESIVLHPDSVTLSEDQMAVVDQIKINNNFASTTDLVVAYNTNPSQFSTLEQSLIQKTLTNNPNSAIDFTINSDGEQYRANYYEYAEGGSALFINQLVTENHKNHEIPIVIVPIPIPILRRQQKYKMPQIPLRRLEYIRINDDAGLLRPGPSTEPLSATDDQVEKLSIDRSDVTKIRLLPNGLKLPLGGELSKDSTHENAPTQEQAPEQEPDTDNSETVAAISQPESGQSEEINTETQIAPRQQDQDEKESWRLSGRLIPVVTVLASLAALLHPHHNDQSAPEAKASSVATSSPQHNPTTTEQPPVAQEAPRICTDQEMYANALEQLKEEGSSETNPQTPDTAVSVICNPQDNWSQSTRTNDGSETNSYSSVTSIQVTKTVNTTGTTLEEQSTDVPEHLYLVNIPSSTLQPNPDQAPTEQSPSEASDHSWIVADGMGGEALFAANDLDPKLWYEYADALLKQFPANFYRMDDGGVGITKSGDLPQEVKDYLDSL